MFKSLNVLIFKEGRNDNGQNWLLNFEVNFGCKAAKRGNCIAQVYR